MKDTWNTISVGIDILRENDKTHDLTLLPIVLYALQRGVEIAWENPHCAEQILRLNEDDVTIKILTLLSRPLT